MKKSGQRPTFASVVASTIGQLLRHFRAGDKKLAIRQLGKTSCMLRVESAAFISGGSIPEAHVGRHGKSPPLHIDEIPPGCRELSLICEDPDAPMPWPFVHWVVVGLSPEKDILEGGVPTGAREGKNTLRGACYTGPAPPPGHGIHHYHFQVFALDQPLGEIEEVTRDSVVERMRSHVLAAGELVGTYER